MLLLPKVTFLTTFTYMPPAVAGSLFMSSLIQVPDVETQISSLLLHQKQAKPPHGGEILPRIPEEQHQDLNQDRHRRSSSGTMSPDVFFWRPLGEDKKPSSFLQNHINWSTTEENFNPPVMSGPSSNFPATTSLYYDSSTSSHEQQTLYDDYHQSSNTNTTNSGGFLSPFLQEERSFFPGASSSSGLFERKNATSLFRRFDTNAVEQMGSGLSLSSPNSTSSTTPALLHATAQSSDAEAARDETNLSRTSPPPRHLMLPGSTSSKRPRLSGEFAPYPFDVSDGRKMSAPWLGSGVPSMRKRCRSLLVGNNFEDPQLPKRPRWGDNEMTEEGNNPCFGVERTGDQMLSSDEVLNHDQPSSTSLGLTAEALHRHNAGRRAGTASSYLGMRINELQPEHIMCDRHDTSSSCSSGHTLLVDPENRTRFLPLFRPAGNSSTLAGLAAPDVTVNTSFDDKSSDGTADFQEEMLRRLEVSGNEQGKSANSSSNIVKSCCNKSDK
ncbi:unnamed protein product [Amoebophrya sp. A120]|nr:unnamed protein product [Amoebophrya sp. A120]|eukprot:GSA120T00021966001.1